MDEGDLELKQIKEREGEKKYNKYMRFFKGVSKNSNNLLKDSQIFIT